MPAGCPRSQGLRGSRREATRYNSPMQVLALNGSPRLEESNSQCLLNPLLAGMQEAGAEVTQHYLAQLSINYCTGCFSCWTRTPGRCAAWRDDMDLLLPQVLAADFLVLSFPLYVYTMPARVKAFLERLLPTIEPWIIPHPTRPGVSTHPAAATVSRPSWSCYPAPGWPSPSISAR